MEAVHGTAPDIAGKVSREGGKGGAEGGGGGGKMAVLQMDAPRWVLSLFSMATTLLLSSVTVL